MGSWRGHEGRSCKKTKMFAFDFVPVGDKDLDVDSNLALSSVLSSIGGRVLFDGCPDDDMDLV